MSGYCRERYVVLVVQEFFRSGHVYPGLNSSFIALVPKTSEAILVNQFRPLRWVISYLRLLFYPGSSDW